MAEYIEREAALQVVADIMGDCKVDHKHRAINRNIKQIPAADVVEVRHGEWVLEHETYGQMMCSVCGKECPTERKPDPYEECRMTNFYIKSNYCPNCGAKMDGKDDNDG